MCVCVCVCVCVCACIIFCCRSKERKKYSKMSKFSKRFIVFLKIYLQTCMFPASFLVRELIWQKALLMGYSRDLNSLVFIV